MIQHLYPDVLFHVDIRDGRKEIALTIDDGPSDHTEELLDLLKEHDAKCTFFIIGSNVHDREHVIRRMIEEGHECGNHTMNDYPSWGLTQDELRTQIQDTASILSSLGMKHSYQPLFRPGSGIFTSSMVKMIKEMGYRMVLGSIYPHDPAIRSSTINSAYILNRAYPGAIIILHDAKRVKCTIDTLRTVLPHLRNEGYKIVTVSHLLQN